MHAVLAWNCAATRIVGLTNKTARASSASIMRIDHRAKLARMSTASRA
jgi:hypothetical protein